MWRRFLSRALAVTNSPASMRSGTACWSRHMVLPWEDGEEYRVLLEALVAEHKPEGPTEEHLVEELAGIIWRKRRLRLGESAVHHRSLRRASDPHQDTVEAALINMAGEVDANCIGDAICATDEQTAEDMADLGEDQAMTKLFLRQINGSRHYVRPLLSRRRRSPARTRPRNSLNWQ